MTDKQKESKYQHLDAMILARIAGGASQFSAIFSGDVQAECRRIADDEGTRLSPYGIDPFRICDRRLQAMRRAGKIRFNGSGKSMGWERLHG
ncbi:hypothetical protein ASL20_09770 [Cupriavidus necator]|uniref:hypothetical protein n=1 Tax=Cupriavidus necator TaxID=106590 RepID=UPI0007354732|nr:hypothetical protein [Cupriavidus necator]KUE88900.1 hypothetical protein ASL20_09770 [Cupriavidus necator]